MRPLSERLVRQEDVWRAKQLPLLRCTLPNQVQWQQGNARPVNREMVPKVAAVLREWREEGVIEEATSKGTFVHPLVVVPKPNSKVRVCLDCRRLNEQVQFERIKLERLEEFLQLIPQGGYVAATDIKNAYLHVPIPEGDRWAFGFEFQNKVWRFRTMPFGYAPAPAIFTKLLRPLAGQWRAAGIRVLVYLDDIVVAASSESECAQAALRVRNDLEALGFMINRDKCTTPSQQAVVLGHQIDTRSQAVSVPADKRAKLRGELLYTVRKGQSHFQVLRRILGKLRALRLIVPDFRIRTRELLVAVQRRNGKLHPALSAELVWWAKSGIYQTQSWTISPRPEVIFETDASSTGWGARCKTRGWISHGRWTTKAHINVQEMMAVYHTLRKWGRLSAGHRIQWYVDNMTVFHYLRKKGGTKLRLNRIMARILKECATHDIEIVPQYIATDENVVADRLSRLRGANRWTLPDNKFRILERRWGPFSGDLFADSRTARTTSALRYDRGQNALWDAWPSEGTLYAFPPPRLMLRLLERIRREARRVVIVAPRWPTAVWWPKLQRHSTQRIEWSQKQDSWSWIACLVS